MELKQLHSLQNKTSHKIEMLYLVRVVSCCTVIAQSYKKQPQLPFLTLDAQFFILMPKNHRQ